MKDGYDRRDRQYDRLLSGLAAPVDDRRQRLHPLGKSLLHVTMYSHSGDIRA